MCLTCGGWSSVSAHDFVVRQAEVTESVVRLQNKVKNLSM